MKKHLNRNSLTSVSYIHASVFTNTRVGWFFTILHSALLWIKHLKSAKLPWHHNMKLSFWSLSLFFVHTPLWAHIWMVSSLKSHLLCPIGSGSDSVTDWPKVKKTTPCVAHLRKRLGPSKFSLPKIDGNGQSLQHFMNIQIFWVIFWESQIGSIPLWYFHFPALYLYLISSLWAIWADLVLSLGKYLPFHCQKDLTLPSHKAFKFWDWFDFDNEPDGFGKDTRVTLCSVFYQRISSFHQATGK